MLVKTGPGSHGPTRRMLLGGAASTLGSAALTACCGDLTATEVPDFDRTKPIVDAHAHVFNAKDLPGYAFLHEVYVQRYTGVFLEPLMPLFKAYVASVENAAPGFRDEQEAMQRGTRSAPATALLDQTLEKLEKGTLPDAGPKEVQQKTYRDLLELTAPAPPSAPARPSSAAPSPEAARMTHAPEIQRRQLAEFLLQPATAAPRAATPAAQVRAAAPTAPASRGPFAPYADQIRQLFAWFSSFKEYRHERIEAWDKFMRVQGPRFAMPAIVDFGFSLREVDYTPVPVGQQVQLMGELSRRQPRGRLIHGYVPFNPVRFARNEQDATAAIHYAVQEQGFIGFKLYPPMGYQASGNATISMRYFNHLGIADIGGKIDRALDWAYDYCLQNDLTILAHTAPSNSPHGNPYDGSVAGTDDWSRRPNPAFWAPILAKRQKLRVLFGHFGGAYHITRNRAWANSIVDLMMTYPNVYGDFSDYDLVLDDTPERRCRRLELKQYLQGLDAKKQDKLRQRVVFGSDWEMLDLVVGTETYSQNMLGFLTESLGGSTEDYAARNALRMIGLDDPDSATTRRLLRFHPRGSDNHQTLVTFMQLVSPARVASRR